MTAPARRSSRRFSYYILIRLPAFHLHHQASPSISCGPPVADPAILIADSVTRLGPEHVGAVLIAGSHGGVYAACLAARAGLRAVILNDAGVGLDRAGIAGLAYLDGYGMAAAVVSHETGRIGD